MARTEVARLTLELLLEAVRTSHKLRALGRRIGAVSEEGGGVWGVLRSLHLDGPQTVPQLARARPVARQHIQTIVNGLLAEGLVRLKANPAHKRSRLVDLTAQGRRRYAEIEAVALALSGELGAGLDAQALTQAFDVLARLNAALDGRLAEAAPPA